MDIACPKAIAFDVFGTLCGGNASPGPYAKLRDEFQLDRDLFRFYLMTTSLSLDQIFAKLDVEINSEKQSYIELIEREIKQDLENVFLFEDAISSLYFLKQAHIPYGLISNLAAPYKGRVIELLSELDLLPPEDLIFCSFERSALKPDPKLYLDFCRAVAVEPHQVLMIGDSERNDYLAAKNCGLQARLLRRGNIVVSAAPHELINDLSPVQRLFGIEVGKLSKLNLEFEVEGGIKRRGKDYPLHENP